MKLNLAALAVLLAGCGGSGGGAAAAPAQAEGAVRLQEIGSFDEPLYVTAPPGDERRVFVVEQGGAIRVVRGGETLGTPFLDLSDRVQSGGEQGLLSMAFAPDYATSGLFYVYYTDADGDQRVVEYRRRSEDQADPGSARLVLLMRDDEPNHNGGLLLFGPDGLLYIGTGDGGGAGDQHGARGNGQSWARCWARSCASTRAAAPAGRTPCRARTRSSGAPAPAARSTATACAIPGASRSTAGRAT